MNDYRKKIMVLLALLLSSLILFHALIEYNKYTGRLHAQHGVLDISGIELEDNNKYLLSGEWEIYDGVLIDPGEIESYSEIMTYMSSGRNSIDSGSHNRTYKLKILTHDMH